MSRMLLAALVVAASVLQLGVVPAFAMRPATVPLLPVALLAAWGVLRGPSEVFTALPVAALTLGVASQERVGSYLIALIPVALALALMPSGERSVRRIAWTPALAVAGSAGYLGVLIAADGRARELLSSSADVSMAAAGTALIATVVAALCWRLRGHPQGLFE